MRKQEVKKGLGLHARRVIAYTVLIIISFFSVCSGFMYCLLMQPDQTANFRQDLPRFRAHIYSITGTISFAWNTSGHQRPCEQSDHFILKCSIDGLFFSTMTAYAIHAYDFRLKKYIYTFILAVMMIPTQVTALGFIRLMRSMNLMDSFIPLIVPAVAAPVTFFYMKQYMESTLPLSLIEAARIDGSGEFRTFNSIVLPLMKPAIAVQAIFGFVSSWNNYFTPALILQSDNKKTLPILIAQLRAKQTG